MKIPVSRIVLLFSILAGLVLFILVQDNGFSLSADKGAFTVPFTSIGRDWRFYPGLFIQPSIIDRYSGTVLRHFDAPLRPFFSRSFYYPSEQFGTLRIEVNGSEDLENAAVMIPPFYSAYRLFINGREAAVEGTPSPTKKNEKGAVKMRIVDLPDDEKTVELVFHFSNYSLSVGRLAQSVPVIAGRDILERRFIIQVILHALLGMILLVLAVLSFGMFFSRRSAREYLVLAGFSITAFLRMILSGPGILKVFLSGIPLQLLARLDFFLISVSVPFIFGVISVYFPKRIPRILPKIIWMAGGAAAAAVLVLPASLGGSILFYYGLVCSVCALVPAVLLIPGKQDEERSFGVRLGYFVLLAAALHDFMFVCGIIHTMYLNSYGIFVFAVSLGIFILRREYRGLADLGRYNQRLALVEKSRDELFSYTSHELRNPLNGIIGLSESLLHDSPDPLNPDQRISLSLIAASGMQLSNQVNDLLDFTRIKSGEIALNLRPVDLYQIAELTKNIMIPLISGKPHTIRNAISREIGLVQADENRLGQILYSLINAGIKLTKDGVLTIAAEENGAEVILVFSGTNFTVGQDDLQLIFDFFEREEEFALKGLRNTGIGLAVIKSLIEKHGGKLQISAGDNEISVKMSLLRCSEETASCEDIVSIIDADSLDDIAGTDIAIGDDTVKRFSILVAEDNAADAQIIKNLLTSMGFNVTATTDGEEALQSVGRSQYDLALIDTVMPRMNGYEICRKIREHYDSTRLPIILVLSKLQSHEMMHGLTVGANDFLFKPFNQEEFITRVKTHLNLAKLNMMYSKFVPIEFIRMLGYENLSDLQIGDHIQQEMTIYFADIRSFTNLSESMTPKENFKFINSYLSRLSPIIKEHRGFVDKYMGDAILAIFPQKPEDSIDTAVAMVRHMQIYNRHRNNSGYRPIRIGVGIHTGNLILGIIGDGSRMQGTVISDSVNLASRIQDVTKLYGSNIVISQDTFVRLENPTNYDFRFLGKVRVKGKENVVSLFEIFDGDEEPSREIKLRTKAEFESGIFLFAKREFADASDIFKEIVEKNPDDAAARLFYFKAEELIKALA